MARITKPIGLDETSQDVVAKLQAIVVQQQNIVSKLDSLLSAVKPNATDIHMSSGDPTTVAEELSELNSKLNNLQTPTLLGSNSTTTMETINFTSIESRDYIFLRLTINGQTVGTEIFPIAIVSNYCYISVFQSTSYYVVGIFRLISNTQAELRITALEGWGGMTLEAYAI